MAALIAFALSAPFFWLNRSWVYDYYLIGHFTGPESALRSPNMGITRSLSWLSQNWWSLHVGAKCAWLILSTTLGLVIAARVNQPQNPRPAADLSSKKTHAADWGILGAIFLLAPTLVLTLHNQKSELVLSILLPGAIVLVLGLWQSLANYSANRSFPAILSWAVLAVSSWLAVNTLAKPARAAGFEASARKVNALADYFYHTQLKAKLVNPRLGADQVTDSLDGQIMRVLCYERHKTWVPFIMTLPTGIMEEKPEVLMERLRQSDFMFLTERMPSEGAWPYDRQMRRLYPQLKAWCEQNLQPVETFPLFDRQMMLYQRRNLP